MKTNQLFFCTILFAIVATTFYSFRSSQELSSLFSDDIISYAESQPCPPSKCQNGGCYAKKCNIYLKTGGEWSGIGVKYDIEVSVEACDGYFACCMCEANKPKTGDIYCSALCYTNKCCKGLNTY